MAKFNLSKINLKIIFNNLKLVSARFFILLIRSYQLLLSPLLGNCCRFHPSCSHYALQAISEHGCIKGGLLSIKRLLCCHPFHPGGVDLVPTKVKVMKNKN